MKKLAMWKDLVRDALVNALVILIPKGISILIDKVKKR